MGGPCGCVYVHRARARARVGLSQRRAWKLGVCVHCACPPFLDCAVSRALRCACVIRAAPTTPCLSTPHCPLPCVSLLLVCGVLACVGGDVATSLCDSPLTVNNPATRPHQFFRDCSSTRVLPMRSCVQSPGLSVPRPRPFLHALACPVSACLCISSVASVVGEVRGSLQPLALLS